MALQFGGESFLQVALPDFSSETRTVALLLFANAIFWVLLLPALANMSVEEEESVGEGAANNDNHASSSFSSNGKTPIDGRRSARDKTTRVSNKTTKGSSFSTTINTTKKPLNNDKEDTPPPVMTATHSVTFLLVGTFCIFLLKSPYNYYTPRRVFMAPLLTRTECQHVMAMAERAALKNYQQSVSDNEKIELELANSSQAENEDIEVGNEFVERYQKNQILQLEPHGWQKIRHASYPTTDLNLVTDPFTSEDRLWLSERFHARLAPLLSRVFGIPPLSIRANDMFVVRYDAPPGALEDDNNDDKDDNAVHRAFLANHTDDSDISFNILLNDDFKGGGTQFWDRFKKQPFAHVQPTTPGTVLTHSALINHEGATVTHGTRMILVGFLSVDRVNPFVPDQSTGLSFWASWGCVSWLTTKFKQAHMMGKRSAPTTTTNNSGTNANKQPSWTNNAYFRRLILDLVGFFQLMGDVFGTHAVEQLVPNTEAETYLQALDEAAERELQTSTIRSSDTQAVWWHGQGLHIGVDGSIASEWQSRQENKQAFEEL